jgi:beta-glucanase (GH16 family)
MKPVAGLPAATRIRSGLGRLAFVAAAPVATACLIAPVAMAAFAMTPTWSDEFTGPAGSPPDPSKWGYNVGGPGWGNGEVQVYTSSRKNSGLDGKGHLLITVQRTGNNYTSAYLTTNDKFEFTYGRVEASIKMPVGNGMNSAFWTVGTNIDTVGWPQSGEIDMVEYLGKGNSYHVGLHGPLTAQPTTQWQYGVDPKTSSNLSAGYHTYWVEKEPDKVTVGIDDTVVKTWTRDSLAPGEEWVFEAPSHVLLDVAVGGTVAGPCRSRRSFPHRCRWTTCVITPTSLLRRRPRPSRLRKRWPRPTPDNSCRWTQ